MLSPLFSRHRICSDFMDLGICCNESGANTPCQVTCYDRRAKNQGEFCLARDSAHGESDARKPLHVYVN